MYKLVSVGSTNGAGTCTCAALDASFSVDDVLAVAFRDSAYGALSCASTTSDALIRNLICH